MTQKFKNSDPKQGLNYTPSGKGKVVIVEVATDRYRTPGIWLDNGYTRTPELLVSFKNYNLIKADEIPVPTIKSVVGKAIAKETTFGSDKGFEVEVIVTDSDNVVRKDLSDTIKSFIANEKQLNGTLKVDATKSVYEVDAKELAEGNYKLSFVLEDNTYPVTGDFKVLPKPLTPAEKLALDVAGGKFDQAKSKIDVKQTDDKVNVSVTLFAESDPTKPLEKVTSVKVTSNNEALTFKADGETKGVYKFSTTALDEDVSVTFSFETANGKGNATKVHTFVKAVVEPEPEPEPEPTEPEA